MSHPKHTQGPWIATDANGRYNNARNSWSVHDEDVCCSESAPITLPDGKVIAFAVTSSDDFFGSSAENDANARLIAASPALYGFVQFIAMRMQGTEVGREAEALITTIGNH